MVSYKNSPRCRINFASDMKQVSTSKKVESPPFHGGETIFGEAIFATKEKHCSWYRIKVKGVITTAVGNGVTASMNARCRYKVDTFLDAIVFDGSTSPIPSFGPRFETTVPFAFSTTNDVDDASDTVSIIQALAPPPNQLPPSLDTRHENSGMSKLFAPGHHDHGSIVYFVSAFAYAEGKVVASTSRSFDFVPLNEPHPPVALEDFPDEYSLRTTKMSTLGAVTIRVGMVGEEPPPLIVTRPSRTGQTHIKLHVMIFGNGLDESRMQRLPVRCSFVTRLRTTTYITPHRASLRRPTLLEMVRYGREGAVTYTKNHEQTHQIRVTGWTVNERPCEQNDEQDAQDQADVWITTIEFSFYVKGKSLPIPEFHTPILSRCYAVELSLTLNLDVLTSLQLRLPVQIVHTVGP